MGSFAVLQIAFTPALNYPYGNPVPGFQTSPSWNQFLNTTAPFFSPTTAAGQVFAAGYRTSATASAGLKFFGEYVPGVNFAIVDFVPCPQLNAISQQCPRNPY